MSKDVKINGVNYTGVPSVKIPLTVGGGYATFVDTDSGDAVAADMRSGKKAWVDGVEITGSVAVRDSEDVAVSGGNVTVPAGLYDAQVSVSLGTGAVLPNAEVASDFIDDTPTTGVGTYPITIDPKATLNAGYIAGGTATGTQLTKYIQVEEKTVVPSLAEQVINHTARRLMSKVTVQGVDVQATANESDVVAGKTFFSNTLTRKTGTAHFPTITQSSIDGTLNIQ